MLNEAYHVWGDNWPYWKELGQAESYIYTFVKRYSRCILISKEKYGTIRYEHIYPPNPKWISKLLLLLFGSYKVENLNKDTSYTVPRVRYINTFIYRYHTLLGKKVLDIAIKRAVTKFPNVKDEILDDYDIAYL